MYFVTGPCQNSEDPHCYGDDKNSYIFKCDTKDWFSARANCLNGGSNLVVFRSSSEHDAVSKYIKEQKLCGTNSYWIGLSKVDYSTNSNSGTNQNSKITVSRDMQIC